MADEVDGSGARELAVAGRAALRVAASPEAAFTAFTRDIGLWWKSHPLFQLSRRGDAAEIALSVEAPWQHGGRCGQAGAGQQPAKKQKGPPKRSFAARARRSAVLT